MHKAKDETYNSLPEYCKYDRAKQKRKTKAAIRVNPDVDYKTHKYITTGKKETKFGVDIERAKKVFARYAQNESVELCAIHIHLGSGGKTISPYVEAVEKILPLIETLRQQGYSPAWHHYPLPGFRGDVDVYAEKEGQILICECRFFEEYDPARHAVEVNKVRQALDCLNFLRETRPGVTVEAWVVSNAQTAWDDAWSRAGQDVRLMTTGPISHRFRTSLLDWGISQIKPMKPPKRYA